MSHLPLDARAILHYLNELGYRNISATQLKEFLKGMQPQSEINSKCKFKTQQQQQQQQLPTTPTSRNTTRTTTTTILQQTPTTTAAAAATATTASEFTKRSPAVKVVKCKKPLCHFKFYLDIRDHQLTKRIEEQIKLLGGSLEFFLTSSVTHFVTDKPIAPPSNSNINNTNNNNNNNTSCPGTPQTPQTPQTPLTPYSLDCLVDSSKPNNGLASNKKPIRNSRADAILNRARRLSTINVSTPTTSHHNHHPSQSKGSTLEQISSVTPLKHKQHSLSNNATGGTPPLPYVVWQCEIALRFFKKVQHELKDYLDHSSKSNSKSYAVEPISLKGGYIKFESLKRNYRPYYHLIKKPQEWPKIQLSREDGAFRLSPKKDLTHKEVEEIEPNRQILEGAALDNNMTRKSRTKSSQNHPNNLKNKDNDLIKSPANSQKQSTKCKNQTAAQQQKDSSDKQCGVCEICKIEYDALTIHLKTKDHEYFAKNSQNFIALDSLIHSSADVNKFLDENRKLEIKTELEEMEVDHEGLMCVEQDPLQNSENEHENHNEDDDEEDDDDDEDGDESQKSSSTHKRKSVESKMVSPTLREKSKRSTKGKHSSEKFQNCTLTTAAKSPKTPSPQKPLAALDVKTPVARRKVSSTAAISPPIRAMLPPNSLYKVVETHTEVNCTPPRGKGLAAGLNDDTKVVGSPSIIVKFKKVRTTELQVLNGEAENFMFPKKRSDSSDLPTDIDRQTTSDRIQQTQSSQQILTSSSSSSSEEQDNDDDFDVKHSPPQMQHNGKKAIIKAKRRLSKVCSSSSSRSTLGGEFKQSFPKTPIQPNEQLKSETNKSTTAIIGTTKRKSLPSSTPNNIAKTQNVTAVVSVSNKIVLPEATRKSSRTATAIVTAATTSTRLLQAAVEAAKSKQKMEISTKSKLPPPPAAPAKQNNTTKKLQIKQEPKHDSEEEEDENVEDEDDDGKDELHKNTNQTSSRALRCSRRSVVKLEDRMGDSDKKPQKSLSNKKLIQGFDVDDYEDDDDITIDGDDDDDDDEKDEDFIVQPVKGKAKQSAATAKKQTSNTSITAAAAAKSSSKAKPSKQTSALLNLSLREERLARRQSRLITQLQLELQTGSEEEQVNVITKPKLVEKKAERVSIEKTPTKSAAKPARSTDTLPKKSPTKVTSPIKQESSSPSRYFDYTKSERLKTIRYAFERLPDTDLWYRVYKRQDNCEEKYFEYFGSTKYRKLPYELGPIPFETTLLDNNKTKICCKLCQDSQQKQENVRAQKLQVRRDLHLDLKPQIKESFSNKTNLLESQEDHNCSTSSAHEKQQQDPHNSSHEQDYEHSKSNCSSSGNNLETKSYAHKHKKLHLLQRYQQELEQQELMQRQKLEDQVKSARTDSSRVASGSVEIKTEIETQQDGLLPSRLDRAGSCHSNASSCGSSTNVERKWKKMGAKLAKLSMLANLELPPRKSPREHASTLALVSCIIKQRQDSLSKPNSETDEPPTTPTERESKVLSIAAEQLRASEVVLEKEPPKTPPPSARKTTAVSPAPNVINSPRTRSQAATPIEELRFATEISETVKRMRRGRNKYDYSPPFVQRTTARPRSGRGRGRGGSNSVVNLFGSDHKPTTSTTAVSGSQTRQRSNTPNTNLQLQSTSSAVTRGRRRRGRQKGYNNVSKNPINVLASIRKTGSKKGVLEFDVDHVAMEALKKATTDYVNPKLLEWQIDKFLTLANKEYENDLLLTSAPVNITTPPEEREEEEQQQLEDTENIKEFSENIKTDTEAINDVNLITPPATDYFSSDFDLCDLINQSSERLQEEGDNNGRSHDRRSTNKFSIFNAMHMSKYYRKRKNPKSNRTGWPKTIKKKAATRQQSMQDKIYFLQNGDIREEKCNDRSPIKREVMDDNMALDEDDTTQEQDARESGVITPPDSENELEDNDKLAAELSKTFNANADEESMLMEEDSQMALDEDSQTANDDDDDDEDGEEEEEGDEEEEDLEQPQRVIEEDNETLADSIEDEEEEEEEQQREQKADSDADADIEEADEEDQHHNGTTQRDQSKSLDFNKKLNKKCKKIIPKIIENDDEDSYEPQEKRPRCLPDDSPVEKMSNLLNPNTAHTSTPITPFMRALRRTPQLNGSLGSCISPSEKAGDNSDIFTVSSDGLDTDMDLSNSHSQLRTSNALNDDEEHHHHHQHNSVHNNSSSGAGTAVTPKRKFDISKYAPTNAATCAAEAATAAVKSLAISQFLKKEVRVTCRRLRAPFRRFRYRR